MGKLWWIPWKIGYLHWLVVLTILKHISQWEGLYHILWKIKHVPNHLISSCTFRFFYSHKHHKLVSNCHQNECQTNRTELKILGWPWGFTWMNCMKSGSIGRSLGYQSSPCLTYTPLNLGGFTQLVGLLAKGYNGIYNHR
jgi:hypothetical protein